MCGFQKINGLTKPISEVLFRREEEKATGRVIIFILNPGQLLRGIRNYIAENGQEFMEITEDEDFKKVYPEMYDHKLKTAPKGFPKDHEFIDLLRYQSYVFSTPLADKMVVSDLLVENIVQSFRELYKLNDFLNRAVDKYV
jgi:uncharacterized protein (TIGR02453 family)